MFYYLCSSLLLYIVYFTLRSITSWPKHACGYFIIYKNTSFPRGSMRVYVDYRGKE